MPVESLTRPMGGWPAVQVNRTRSTLHTSPLRTRASYALLTERPAGTKRVTTRTTNCPNCGAPIEFLWSSAVQTTCAYCRSILVRHDVDLARVGVVGDLPPDASPIQRGAEGKWAGR